MSARRETDELVHLLPAERPALLRQPQHRQLDNLIRAAVDARRFRVEHEQIVKL